MPWCRQRALAACPAGLPELQHAMTHPISDLAVQFDEILNLAETFGPLLPLDAAVTFYAPLASNTRDVRGAADTFARNTAAVWRHPSGNYYLVPSNTARFEDGSLLMEPARINKCTNYNAEPDEALTGITKVGDPFSTIIRVDDTGALVAAGLDTLAGPLVLELDNQLGGADASIEFGGVTGTTAPHAISAFCRKTAGGVGTTSLRLSDNSVIQTFENADYQRIGGAAGSVLATANLRLTCAPGAVARIILNQLEESTVATSPILTTGKSGDRSADLLSWAESGAVNDAQGMLVIGRVTRYDAADGNTTNQNEGIASVTGATGSLCRYVNTDAQADAIQAYDGTNFRTLILGTAINQQVHKVATRWNAGANQLQVGISLAGAWQWSTEGPYDGSWNSNGTLSLGLDIEIGATRFADFYVYNEDRGTAWIEANH